MIFNKGRLHYTTSVPANHVHFFTANNVVQRNGELVMGGGCAKAVRDLIQGSAKRFGDLEKKNPDGRIHSYHQGRGLIASFQTKEHWKFDSPLWLIQSSTDVLAENARSLPKWTFHLPLPGCALGGLKKEDVLPILAELPDNVIVYTDEEMSDNDILSKLVE